MGQHPSDEEIEQAKVDMAALVLNAGDGLAITVSHECLPNGIVEIRTSALPDTSGALFVPTVGTSSHQLLSKWRQQQWANGVVATYQAEKRNKPPA